MYSRIITPENITELQPNEIFVFGSNLSGWHSGGAALIACQSFGAIYGKGIGIMGSSYAIPTKSRGIKSTLPISEIKKHIDVFLVFAICHTDNIFLVTQIGCGLAGYTPKDIAPLFEKALDVENIYLPKQFIEILCKTS
jgi:hypothetical protein